MTDLLLQRASPPTPAHVPFASARSEDCSNDVGIYLDYAATTPVDPAVARAMAGFLAVDGIFGNAASETHLFGRAAAEAVEVARGDVASLLSSAVEEVVWTSGATEAINLAVKGTALARHGRGRHIVTSKQEHKAVLDSARWLESLGFEIGFVEPSDEGTITPENLSKAMRPDTILVSLAFVNNETGSVSDIGALGPVVRRQGALLHVDAVQGVARLPLNDVAAEADLISISAHKMYGPKGIGVLRVRRSVRDELVPLIHGGGHEFGLRSGTLPTHQIAGMGAAARLVTEHRTADTRHAVALDRRLCAHLNGFAGTSINGGGQRVAGILNVYFAGVNSEALILALEGLAISSGSACTSSNIEPSHVLLSLGHDAKRAMSSVRISFGRYTTAEEIDRAGVMLRETVTALRRIAG